MNVRDRRVLLFYTKSGGRAKWPESHPRTYDADLPCARLVRVCGPGCLASPFFQYFAAVIPGILKSLQREAWQRISNRRGNRPVTYTTRFYRIMETLNCEIHGPWTLVQRFGSPLDILCQRSHLLV